MSPISIILSDLDGDSICTKLSNSRTSKSVGLAYIS